MRERVRYGEANYQEFEQGVRRPGRWGRRPGNSRPAPGPRPVRPVGVLATVRPPEAPRPVREAVAGVVAARAGARGDDVRCGRSGPRLLVRAGAGVREPSCVGSRLRRMVAGLGLVAASAVLVVALGLLARVAERAPAPVGPAAPVVVTAGPGETVWEVAARLAPGRPGAEVAAVAERIVADNALRSARLEPGQVLRVAGG